MNILQDSITLQQSARHMETSLPLASLEIQQHLAATVRVTEPLSVPGVREPLPGIIMNPAESGGDRVPAEDCLMMFITASPGRGKEVR